MPSALPPSSPFPQMPTWTAKKSEPKVSPWVKMGTSIVAGLAPCLSKIAVVSWVYICGGGNVRRAKKKEMALGRCCCCCGGGGGIDRLATLDDG